MHLKATNTKQDFLSNRFESLVENGLDCVLILSENIETKYVSRSIKKIMGYTPDEVLQMNILEHVHPDDLAGSHEVIVQALQNPGVPIQGHLSRVKHRDGSWRWIDAVVTNMLHDPAINGIVDNIRDVTDNVLAQKQANEFNERLLAATKAAKIGVWEFDLIQNELHWNDGMFELYGVDKNDFVCDYKSWVELIHPDDRLGVKTKTDEILSGISEFVVEYRIIKPDGALRHIKSIGQIQKNEEGKPFKMIGTNWDITSSRKSKEKFRKLLEAAPDAMVIINKDNLIELVNSETERMFSYSKSELIGQPVELLLPKKNQKISFLHKDDFSKYTKSFLRKADKDFFARKKNGQKFPVEINIGTLDTGDEFLISAAIRDITKRKRTEDLLRNMAAIKAKNEEMEELAYITSHDLREPLLTLKRYSEVLQEMFQDTLKDEGKVILDTIIQSADRMESRINDLLNYSQLGQTKNLEPVDCNEIVKIVIEDLNSLIESKEAKVIVETLPDDLKAYPTELQLIFQNLINNAIKFRKESTPPIIHISSKKHGDTWEFQVADNGIGISKKDYKKIFSIFQKLNSSSTYQGSGIGLTQVKKLVELHNGKIWLSSELNKGTTFIFSLNTENL